MIMVYPWTSRKFASATLVELFPNVIERLRGTAARVEDKVRPLPVQVLTKRDGDKWSIQEHIGHLIKVEELHVARLDDFRDGLEVLRPADMQNKSTFAADFNNLPLPDVLKEFRSGRKHLVDALDHWDPALITHIAQHPRLKQPMSIVDMALFVAEHDDHHLAKMTELVRKFAPE